MDDKELALRISAKTDEFVKNVEDAKIKVRSLSMQMAEIDKQLKTESVDRVQKLGEKLELAKRASAAASEEAKLYAEKVNKLTEKHKDLNNMTDKQKESLLKLSEQMATAEQKANTYAAEVDKLEKEYKENAQAAESAGSATQDFAESLSDASKETEKISEKTKDSGKNTERFFDRLKEGVSINLVSGGLAKIASWFGNIASKAWEAAKAAASFVKNYATEAVDLAADYADALGYSEQIFTNHAETVQKWVQDNSVALRINKSDLQGYINSMGSLYRSFGMSSEQAAQYSEGLVTLATDLRAATGDDTKQIIESLTSIMTGGYKSGYKYGIVINEAAVKAKALAMGLADVAVDEYKVEKARISLEKATKKASEASVKYGENSLEAQEAQLAAEAAATAFEEALGGQTLALTQAQKEAAIYALVMEQTTHMQGQGARESGSYKSQLEALKTTFDNLKISVGEKLLPVFNGFVTEFNNFIGSEEGKEFLDGIVTGVEKISEKALELINNGTITEWFNKAKEKLPEITDKIIELAEEIGELIPKLLDLTDEAMTFFGIGEKAEVARTQEAFIRVKEKVEEFAKESGLSLEQATAAVQAYADENGRSAKDVYDNWDKYEPEIETFYRLLATGADGTATDFETAMEKLPPAVQDNLDKAANPDFTQAEALRAKVRGWANDISEAAKDVWNWLTDFWDGLSNIGRENIFVDSNGNEQHYGRATGGPVRAGQMYQVNDDFGRRREMFVPAMDGYILNGSDTQRVINNSTNNSRTYGDVNVYVTSYGADAASIADELGAEVSRKLRLSGTW